MKRIEKIAGEMIVEEQVILLISFSKSHLISKCMYRIMIFLFFVSYFHSFSVAQICEKIQIKDPILIDAIGEFMISCSKANNMYKDMGGVFEMYIYPDSGKEEKRIELVARLEDRFKDNPPRKYAYLWGKIILVYEYDSNNKLPQNNLTKEQLNTLLDEVGDRVFVAQNRFGRWVEKYNEDGSLKSRSFQRQVRMGGSPFNITLLINKKTGEVKKLKSV
ncbi:MAG: hypothetical protein R2822_11040 [Spirosomataceae bacterium]